MRADAAIEASTKREERMVVEIKELKRKLETAEANARVPSAAEDKLKQKVAASDANEGEHPGLGGEGVEQEHDQCRRRAQREDDFRRGARGGGGVQGGRGRGSFRRGDAAGDEDAARRA